ncbi:MAG TPA: hypothetical protein PLV68_15220 [Ilumatobacteraceae bacterium]|nr:hypothetical protein [Ilumatobacteraceae bacterium]
MSTTHTTTEATTTAAEIAAKVAEGIRTGAFDADDMHSLGTDDGLIVALNPYRHAAWAGIGLDRKHFDDWANGATFVAWTTDNGVMVWAGMDLDPDLMHTAEVAL